MHRTDICELIAVYLNFSFFIHLKFNWKMEIMSDANVGVPGARMFHNWKLFHSSLRLCRIRFPLLEVTSERLQSNQLDHAAM